MFDRIFGGSDTRTLPDDVQLEVEKRLFDFCYYISLAIAYAGQASNQTRGDMQETLHKIESAIALTRGNIDGIEAVWPAGRLAVADLREIANMLPSWLANFRAWQDYIANCEENKIREINKNEYQGFVLRNRECLDKLDRGLESARRNLSKAGIAFRSIEAKSAERLVQDAENGAIA